MSADDLAQHRAEEAVFIMRALTDQERVEYLRVWLLEVAPALADRKRDISDGVPVAIYGDVSYADEAWR